MSLSVFRQGGFRSSRDEIGDTLRVIQEHENDIRSAWQRHLGS